MLFHAPYSQDWDLCYFSFLQILTKQSPDPLLRIPGAAVMQIPHTRLKSSSPARKLCISIHNFQECFSTAGKAWEWEAGTEKALKCGGHNLLPSRVCWRHLNWELCSLIIKPPSCFQSLASKPFPIWGLVQLLWQWPFLLRKKEIQLGKNIPRVESDPWKCSKGGCGWGTLKAEWWAWKCWVNSWTWWF